MPGGAIVFAGEPLLRDAPIPWRVRLDGHSLWAIRTFGWMDLGFNEDAFIALLRRHNLSVQRLGSACIELPCGDGVHGSHLARAPANHGAAALQLHRHRAV